MPSSYCSLETMKKIRFGVEIELAGDGDTYDTHAVSHMDAARAIHRSLGGQRTRNVITGLDGRRWSIVDDASIEGCAGFELVTPICDYYDIPIVQHALEQLVSSGARADDLCGIHVHIDGSLFDAPAVTRLVKLCYQQEDVILAALGERAEDRAYNGVYCMPTKPELIERLVKSKPKTLPELREAWYPNRSHSRTREKYDDSRYHGVNIHSLFYRGTIEFRWYPTTTSSSVLKTYIQLSLALGAKALNGRATRAAKRELKFETNMRYAARTLLVRLGLNGEEFRSLRRHLLDGLDGDISYAKPLGNDNHRVSA